MFSWGLIESATEKHRINRCFSYLCGGIRNLTLTRFCDLRDSRAEQMSQNTLFRHYVPYEPSSSARKIPLNKAGFSI